MTTKQLLKQIAIELDSMAVYDEFQNNIARLKSPKTRLCIIGQPVCGKTTLINALLSLNLPVSTLPSNKRYVITYDENGESANGENNIHVKNEWVNKNNLEIVELTQNVALELLSQIDLCKMLSQFDICIYIMSSTAAFNRTDKFILQNLNEVALQTKVVLSRTDLLSDDDYTKVAEFVKSNLKEFTHVGMIDVAKGHLGKIESNLLMATVEDMLNNADMATTRSNFENFYLGYALSKLFEVCQTNISVCMDKQDKVRKLAADKKTELGNKSTDWLKLETQLRQRMSDISSKLRQHLKSRESDISKRLTHDIDMCGDVKQFWEVSFPFRLEELMKLEVSSATQMINQELTKTLQWLQDSLFKQFRCRISVASGIASESFSDSMVSMSNVEISNTNKLRTITRIGTVATVLVAGTLAATAGIGGVIMAVGMLSGIGSEYFIRKKSNEAKDNIKQHLPEIISRAQLKVVTDFDQKIQDLTGEFIAQLQTLEKEWEESSIKSIEQEESIAIYNFNPAKWENVMSRINQLSEIVLK